jgi:phosphatidylinositol alpha-1,6-mannosyltransferase
MGRLGVDPKRVQIIPELVPAGEATDVSSAGPLQVIHAGRILPAKGQHLSVDAISRLSPDDKQRVELHIVGRVADRQYYDQLRIAARGQPVVFHEDVDDLDAQLRRADLLLYPTSLRGEWPDVALRAMSWGVAVAWTDHASVREAVGGLGLPLPPEDFHALRATLRNALDDRFRLAAMGDAGRLFVEANYGWDRVGRQWDALFEEIAPGAGNADSRDP